MLNNKLDNFIIASKSKLTDAMQKIDQNGKNVIFIVDEKNILCGALSDGDIRRWLVSAGDINSIVDDVMNKTPKFVKEDNLVDAGYLFEQYPIKALPVVDNEGCIVDVIPARGPAMLKKYQGDILTDVPVVIMAGGKGTRLYPYTKILPKPLIPIGGIPIVERIINEFTECGATNFYMTVNYKKNMIRSYFSDIEKEYDIEYIEEDVPLGTAGGLKLLNESFSTPIFVSNSDCLIKTDYTLLYKHHREMDNAITVVTAVKNDTIPYGVVYSEEEGRLTRIEEKPTRSYLVNTGMYVINANMINLIPEGEMFHMTQLVEKALAQGFKVGIYPVSEEAFLDMGEFAEMKRMEEKLGLD